MSNIKKLIIGRVYSVEGYPTQIFDAENNHIADVNVRSWGRLQYMHKGDELHHELSSWVRDAINEKLARDGVLPRIISESDIDPENIPYIPMPGKNKKTFKLTEDKRTAVCPDY